MNASDRVREVAELQRRAVERAHATTIRSLWNAYAAEFQFETLAPAVVDKLRAAFFEGAWRVSEIVNTVADDLGSRVLEDMTERLVDEAFAFDDSPEARRAFGSGEDGTE